MGLVPRTNGGQTVNHQDIRWQQRFSHYQKALRQLSSAVELSRQRPLSELEEQGLIQAFEFTHELAWNVMKDYFEYQGNTSITGSRDATREAFRRTLITDGEGWMEMIQSRNKTSHAYNREVADEIAEKVTDVYHDLFMAFEKRMQDLKNAD
jgi:nucleotidyltransferase substrate binding protein (TIGR01987 family)